jgi:hypothetical protein
MLNGLHEIGGMTYRHTGRCPMGRANVAVSLDESTVERLERLVKKAAFP